MSSPENGNTPYAWLHRLANETGFNLPELIAMSSDRDPFYMGQEAQVRDAEWFARIWHELGYGDQTGIHLRRLHYRLSGDARRYSEGWLLPETTAGPAEPYENTEKHFKRLLKASAPARHLRMVDPHAFVDRRNPDPHIYMFGDPEEPSLEVEEGLWDLPSISGYALDVDIQLPQVTVSGYDYRVNREPYLVELWIEKSTMNDILKPLCAHYGVNLITGVGYMSISSVMRLVERARKADKPVRLLYASDFDPAGKNMPISPARQIEYVLRRRGEDLDISLDPVILTREQVEDYELPPVPLKERDSRTQNFMERYGVSDGAELDALEAEHPGELRRLFEERILEFRDADLRRKLRETEEEAQEDAEAELERRLEPHLEEIEAIRVEAQEIAACYRERLEALSEELASEMAPLEERLEVASQSAESAVDGIRDMELPEVEPDYGDPEELEGWLYHSERAYMDQLRRYKLHQGRQLQQQPRQRRCEHCGEPFTAIRSTVQYCSKLCQQRAWRKAHRKPALQVEATCQICKKVFIAGRRDATYCSSTCRKQSWRRKGQKG